MIASASKKISKILFQKNIINENEQEICQYGLEIILSTSVGILLIVLIGIIMHLLVESIVFYSVFVGVRFFTECCSTHVYWKNQRRKEGIKLMRVEKILEKVANLAEKAAVKANGMISWFDTYQPKEPEAVRRLVEQKNGK